MCLALWQALGFSLSFTASGAVTTYLSIRSKSHPFFTEPLAEIFFEILFADALTTTWAVLGRAGNSAVAFPTGLQDFTISQDLVPQFLAPFLRHCTKAPEA